MYAAMENRTLLIERMIELGCDIHAKNKEHYTTLHLASMYSREDTVKLLLGKKADPAVSGGVKFNLEMIDVFSQMIIFCSPKINPVSIWFARGQLHMHCKFYELFYSWLPRILG